ncbi:hypothetical protein [Micropruina glycogenica]|uniref:hypothetical protein n=1 Tax=Micropruina glycogenica TaxID=75385 RepID=UPI00267A1128
MPSMDDWPRDARLDPFRDTVWQLSRGGIVQGRLTCRVVPSRRLPWQKSESVWYRLHWVDGRHELPREDHGPGWPVISDLERGRFVLTDLAGTVFEARQVDGPAADEPL